MSKFLWITLTLKCCSGSVNRTKFIEKNVLIVCSSFLENDVEMPQFSAIVIAFDFISLK